MICIGPLHVLEAMKICTNLNTSYRRLWITKLTRNTTTWCYHLEIDIGTKKNAINLALCISLLIINAFIHLELKSYSIMDLKWLLADMQPSTPYMGKDTEIPGILLFMDGSTQIQMNQTPDESYEMTWKILLIA